MSFDNKQYTIDGEPVSAAELIDRAGELNDIFEYGQIKFTSVAAAILRKNGLRVEELALSEDGKL